MYNTVVSAAIRMCVCVAPNMYSEKEQVAKYEIMDGAPVRGVVYTVT